MTKKLSLYDLQKYILKLISTFPEHKPFLDDLHDKISLRISNFFFEYLFDDEIIQLIQYSEKFPSFDQLSVIIETLKETYIKFLISQFKFQISYYEPQVELMRLYLSIISKNPSAEVTPTYLIQLKKTIKTRLTQLAGQKILNELAFFRNELNEIAKYISKGEKDKILTDIELSFAVVEKLVKKPSANVKKIYKKYQSSEYKIQAINQGYMPILGNSGGGCYGISIAMAIPEYNLFQFQNKNKFFQVTQEINAFQGNQCDKENDQKLVKRTSLSIQHLCPYLLEQAKGIFDFAIKNKGKALLITLQNAREGHACYMKVLTDDKIHYLDSVHGAYCFQKPSEFIEFYLASHLIIPDRQLYSRYHIDELVYAPNQQILTRLDEEFLALLTGPKYPNPYYFLAMLMFHFVLGEFLSRGDFNHLTALFFGIIYIIAMVNKLHGIFAIPNLFYENIIFEFNDLAFNSNINACEDYLAKQIDKDEKLGSKKSIQQNKMSFFETEVKKLIRNEQPSGLRKDRESTIGLC